MVLVLVTSQLTGQQYNVQVMEGETVEQAKARGQQEIQAGEKAGVAPTHTIETTIWKVDSGTATHTFKTEQEAQAFITTLEKKQAGEQYSLIAKAGEQQKQARIFTTALREQERIQEIKKTRFGRFTLFAEEVGKRTEKLISERELLNPAYLKDKDLSTGAHVLAGAGLSVATGIARGIVRAPSAILMTPVFIKELITKPKATLTSTGTTMLREFKTNPIGATTEFITTGMIFGTVLKPVGKIAGSVGSKVKQTFKIPTLKFKFGKEATPLITGIDEIVFSQKKQVWELKNKAPRLTTITSDSKTFTTIVDVEGVYKKKPFVSAIELGTKKTGEQYVTSLSKGITVIDDTTVRTPLTIRTKITPFESGIKEAIWSPEQQLLKYRGQKFLEVDIATLPRSVSEIRKSGKGYKFAGVTETETGFKIDIGATKAISEPIIDKKFTTQTFKGVVTSLDDITFNPKPVTYSITDFIKITPEEQTGIKPTKLTGKSSKSFLDNMWTEQTQKVETIPITKIDSILKNTLVDVKITRTTPKIDSTIGALLAGKPIPISHKLVYDIPISSISLSSNIGISSKMGLTPKLLGGFTQSGINKISVSSKLKKDLTQKAIGKTGVDLNITPDFKTDYNTNIIPKISTKIDSKIGLKQIPKTKTGIIPSTTSVFTPFHFTPKVNLTKTKFVPSIPFMPDYTFKPSKKKKKEELFPAGFAPSLTAKIFNIKTSKKPKTKKIWTGLELRKIIRK